MTALKAAATDLREALESLPKMPAPQSREWLTAQSVRQDALYDLVRVMRRQHGAGIRIGLTDTCQMACCGVTVRHPSLLGMFRRWLDRAEAA